MLVDPVTLDELVAIEVEADAELDEDAPVELEPVLPCGWVSPVVPSASSDVPEVESVAWSPTSWSPGGSEKHPPTPTRPTRPTNKKDRKRAGS